MATYSLFLPGEFHRRGSLAGSSPWGDRESDMTEQSTGKTDLHLEQATQQANRVTADNKENLTLKSQRSSEKRHGFRLPLYEEAGCRVCGGGD